MCHPAEEGDLRRGDESPELMKGKWQGTAVSYRGQGIALIAMACSPKRWLHPKISSHKIPPTDVVCWGTGAITVDFTA